MMRSPTYDSNGRPRDRPSVSRAGVAFLAFGVLTIVVEAATGLIRARLGSVGHWTIYVSGAYFILWGLTEIVTGLWPRFGSGAITKHRFFLPAEGRVFILIIIVVFIGSLLGRSNPLLLVFCCLAGPWVVNGFLIVAMLQGLSIRRVLPPRVMAGESFAVEFCLTNRKRLIPAWMITVRDAIYASGERLQADIVFIHIARRTAQSGTYRASIASRGHVLFGPVIMQSRFPLGIVERGVQLELPGGLLVYPRIGRLAANWRRLTDASHDSTHAAAHVSQAAETFHRLREYQSGDDPRTIHWRTSARRNELMVREFRDERDSPVVLLLDAWRSPYETNGTNDDFELALSLSATVCVQQLRSARDAPVAFAATGSQSVQWNSGFQGDSMESLLDSLAVLETSPSANWKELIAFAARSGERRQTTLLLTTRSDVVREELPKLRRAWNLDRTGTSVRVIDVAEIEQLRILGWT
jgi:uncharacterized protein (DUF58 family)